MSNWSLDIKKECNKLNQELPLFFSLGSLRPDFKAVIVIDFSTGREELHKTNHERKAACFDCKVIKWCYKEKCYENISIPIHFPIKGLYRKLYHEFDINFFECNKKYLIKLLRRSSIGSNYTFQILECKEVKE